MAGIPLTGFVSTIRVFSMFQSFDVTSTPHFGRDRVSALRATFDSLGIDAFLDAARR